MAILNKVQTLILSTLIAGVSVTALAGSSEMLSLSNYAVNPTCDMTGGQFCSDTTIVNLYCNKDIDSMPQFGKHNRTSDERSTSLHAEKGNGEEDSYSWIDDQFNVNNGDGTLKCIVQGIYEDYDKESDTDPRVFEYVDLGWFQFTITDGEVTDSENYLSFDNEIFPLNQEQHYYDFPGEDYDKESDPGQLSTFIQYINPPSQ